jgi:FSR family fosmidomycin resistance protein-like MFS transporter
MATAEGVLPVEAEADTFRTEKIITIAAAHGSHDIYFSFLPTLLPLLKQTYGFGNAEAGLLQIFWQGPALFQPLIGHLSDRFNLRWLIILAPSLSAAMVTLVGVAPTYSVIALLLLVAGFSTAAFHAVAPAMVGLYSGKNVGRGMSFFMVGGELGFAIGPLVVVAAVGYLTLRGLPWLMALGVLASVILYLRIQAAPGVARASAENALPARQALRNMRGMMLPLVGLTFATSFLNASVGTYLPTFMRDEGSSLLVAGASFSVIEVAATFGTLFSGWLSDRFGRRVILVFSMVSSPLFAFLFLSVHGAPQFAALLAIGFASYCYVPPVMAMVQEHFSENRALANGVYLAIQFCVRSLVVVLVGALGDRFGLRPVFWFNAAMMFAALPFVWMLPRR